MHFVINKTNNLHEIILNLNNKWGVGYLNLIIKNKMKSFILNITLMKIKSLVKRLNI